jgi:transposase
MTPSTTTNPLGYREYRRLRAYELKEQGWKQKDIAVALGVTEGAVSQWLKRVRAGGPAALRRRPPPGPRPRLTPTQRARVRDLLEQGAEAAGFEGNVWTSKRIVAVIRREFGVGYHRAHISRLVRTLGVSLQKPVVRAGQRDEAAIDRWRAGAGSAGRP